MTIHVVTTEHGTHSFPDADTWETTKDSCDIPEGGLWVGSEGTDLAVAEFAKGAWQFVYETKDDEDA